MDSNVRNNQSNKFLCILLVISLVLSMIPYGLLSNKAYADVGASANESDTTNTFWNFEYNTSNAALNTKVYKSSEILEKLGLKDEKESSIQTAAEQQILLALTQAQHSTITNSMPAAEPGYTTELTTVSGIDSANSCISAVAVPDTKNWQIVIADPGSTPKDVKLKIDVKYASFIANYKLVLNGAAIGSAMDIPIDNESAIGNISLIPSGLKNSANKDITLVNVNLQLKTLPQLSNDYNVHVARGASTPLATTSDNNNTTGKTDSDNSKQNSNSTSTNNSVTSSQQTSANSSFNSDSEDQSGFNPIPDQSGEVDQSIPFSRDQIVKGFDDQSITFDASSDDPEYVSVEYDQSAEKNPILTLNCLKYTEKAININMKITTKDKKDKSKEWTWTEHINVTVDKRDLGELDISRCIAGDALVPYREDEDQQNFVKDVLNDQSWDDGAIKLEFPDASVWTENTDYPNYDKGSATVDIGITSLPPREPNYKLIKNKEDDVIDVTNDYTVHFKNQTLTISAPNVSDDLADYVDFYDGSSDKKVEDLSEWFKVNEKGDEKDKDWYRVRAIVKDEKSYGITATFNDSAAKLNSKTYGKEYGKQCNLVVLGTQPNNYLEVSVYKKDKESNVISKSIEHIMFDNKSAELVKYEICRGELGKQGNWIEGLLDTMLDTIKYFFTKNPVQIKLYFSTSANGSGMKNMELSDDKNVIATAGKDDFVKEPVIGNIYSCTVTLSEGQTSDYDYDLAKCKCEMVTGANKKSICDPIREDKNGISRVIGNAPAPVSSTMLWNGNTSEGDGGKSDVNKPVAKSKDSQQLHIQLNDKYYEYSKAYYSEQEKAGFASNKEYIQIKRTAYTGFGANECQDKTYTYSDLELNEKGGNLDLSLGLANPFDKEDKNEYICAKYEVTKLREYQDALDRKCITKENYVSEDSENPYTFSFTVDGGGLVLKSETWKTSNKSNITPVSGNYYNYSFGVDIEVNSFTCVLPTDLTKEDKFNIAKEDKFNIENCVNGLNATICDSDGKVIKTIYPNDNNNQISDCTGWYQDEQKKDKDNNVFRISIYFDNENMGKIDDYQGRCNFSLSGKDAFENDMVYQKGGKVDEKISNFTQDWTAPEFQVVWDDSPVSTRGDVQYFNKNSRTATIEVYDKYSWSTGENNLLIKQDISSAWKSKDAGDITAWTGNENYTASITCNSNDDHFEFQVSGQDKAGNTAVLKSDKKSSVYRSPKFALDIVQPSISVVWDNNNVMNDHYFSATRGATITVQETNFEGGLFSFAGGGAEQGWQSYDKTHTNHVYFGADGDFTLDIEGKDIATNANGYHEGLFTIDMTNPTLNVGWDNNNSNNDKYYNSSRTATLAINEHNFNGGSIHVNPIVTPGHDGTMGTTGVSDWTHEGDTHYATVTFPSEGTYSMTVDGVDLAQNPMSPYSQNEFVQDWTQPQIQITNIENRKAYQDVAQPNVQINDTNMSAATTCNVVNLGATKTQPYSASPSTSDTSYTYTYNNPEKESNNDGVYRVEVNAVDMAGNTSTQSLVWSLNRFGSTYVVDSETDKMVNGFISDKNKKDIKVTEINPSDILESSVEMQKGMYTSKLEEGNDYTISTSGGGESWVERVYTINKNFFKDDGKYNFSFSSKDAAGNSNDNNMDKRNPERTSRVDVKFMLDNAKPTSMFNNLSNAQYGEVSHEASVTFEDNSDEFSDAKVYIDNNEEYMSGDDLKKNNNELSFTLKEADAPHKISVVSTDKAGNMMDKVEKEVLVSTNPIVRWFYNTPLFIGTLVGVAVIAAAVVGFIFYRKKKAVE